MSVLTLHTQLDCMDARPYLCVRLEMFRMLLHKLIKGEYNQLLFASTNSPIRKSFLHISENDA